MNKMSYESTPKQFTLKLMIKIRILRNIVIKIFLSLLLDKCTKNTFGK